MYKSNPGRLYQFSITVSKPPSGIINYPSFNIKVLIGAKTLKAAKEAAEKGVLNEFSKFEKLADCKIKKMVAKEIKYDMFFQTPI